MSDNSPFFMRPDDESLEAYKRWITKTAEALGFSGKDDMTDEEWIKDWKEFWGKSTQARRAGNAPKPSQTERHDKSEPNIAKRRPVKRRRAN